MKTYTSLKELGSDLLDPKGGGMVICDYCPNRMDSECKLGCPVETNEDKFGADFYSVDCIRVDVDGDSPEPM